MSSGDYTINVGDDIDNTPTSQGVIIDGILWRLDGQPPLAKPGIKITGVQRS